MGRCWVVAVFDWGNNTGAVAVFGLAWTMMSWAVLGWGSVGWGVLSCGSVGLGHFTFKKFWDGAAVW